MSRFTIRLPEDLDKQLQAVRFDGESKGHAAKRLLLNLCDRASTTTPPTGIPLGKPAKTCSPSGEFGQLKAIAEKNFPGHSDNQHWLWILQWALIADKPIALNAESELLERMKEQLGYKVYPLTKVQEWARDLASPETLQTWMGNLHWDDKIILGQKTVQVLPYPRYCCLTAARNLFQRQELKPIFKSYLSKGCCLTLNRRAIATLKFSSEAPPEGSHVVKVGDCDRNGLFAALRGMLTLMGAPETRSDSPYEALDEPAIDTAWIVPNGCKQVVKVERIQ